MRDTASSSQALALLLRALAQARAAAGEGTPAGQGDLGDLAARLDSYAAEVLSDASDVPRLLKRLPGTDAAGRIATIATAFGDGARTLANPLADLQGSNALSGAAGDAFVAELQRWRHLTARADAALQELGRLRNPVGGPN